ncbi:hypothetical protein ADUPG1_012678 [Aduncisulcus paluster]|uniref:EF-hand domain-containing protein n=1 Tax=Aduncisulcus paluster TaxID=2918883 RepID=A0ABQ5K097_9EUKA|nr:hypothetical protein ADUPG1_012678 [Aduncisulcus paluster]
MYPTGGMSQPGMAQQGMGQPAMYPTGGMGGMPASGMGGMPAGGMGGMPAGGMGGMPASGMGGMPAGGMGGMPAGGMGGMPAGGMGGMPAGGMGGMPAGGMGQPGMPTQHGYCVPGQLNAAMAAVHRSMRDATIQWINAQYSVYLTSQMAQIRQRFMMIDLDKSGWVNATELSRALATGGKVFPESIARKLIRLFDYGLARGSICFQEFAGLDAFINGLRSEFMAIDRARTGRIPFPQVQAILAKQGFSITPQLISALAMAWDRRRTGHIAYEDFIDLSATMALCRSLYIQYTKQGMTMTFDMFVTMCTNFV